MHCNISLLTSTFIASETSSHSTSKYLFYNEFFAVQIHQFIYLRVLHNSQHQIFSQFDVRTSIHDFFLFSNIMSSISNYEIIFMTKHWFYKHFIVSQMKDAELYMTRNSKKQRIQIVECKQCDFFVSVNKWRYSNLSEKHADVCSKCFFSKQYHQYVAEQQVRLVRKRAEQQIEQIRLVKERRLAEQAEETRLIKKRAEFLLQQKIEQTRIEKKRLEIFACRRCFAKFSNNTKLHHHIENHHAKKSANEFAVFTSITVFTSVTFFFTSITKLVKITTNEFAKITSIATFASITFFATFSSSSESALMLTSFITLQETTFDISLSLISFVTSIATSRKQISWIEIVSRSVIASKSSRLSVSTLKSISTCTKTASDICSSFSSKAKHQKLYFIIEDLYEMFDEKFKKSDIFHIKHHIKNDAHFRIIFFFFYQVKIIAYFTSAVNQSQSISQNSKTSNSKSYRQHTFAKSNRVKFTFLVNKWSEKSIVLFYKTSIFSRRSISEISDISSYKMSNISRFQSTIASCKFSIRLSVSIQIFSSFFHVCRICCDIFESNNDLHWHLRTIHFDHASRFESEKYQAFECDERASNSTSDSTFDSTSDQSLELILLFYHIEC